MDIAAGYSRAGTSRVKICRYYLKGVCKFGRRCRFAHEDSKTECVSNLIKYFLLKI